MTMHTIHALKTITINALAPVCLSVVAAACVQSGPAAAADQYKIDASHTTVQFSVLRFGFNHVIGSFLDVDGVITFDADMPEDSAVEAVISVASLESGDLTRNEHLIGEFWFNAAEHDKMSFVSTGIDVTGDATANITGDLTILGVTKPVTLNVVFNKLGADPATKADAVGFSATAKIDRLDWGMETASGLVGNDVEIRIETLAHMVTE